MPHSPAEKKAALTRVRKIKGQIFGIRNRP
ncbi:regulator protein FrmR [Proteus mirabilis]|uniref:Regulator protein FrmR n=1 Tax=Proteus mirabilis TaxID=584 RepID=A0A2X2BU02_PROMI|nr:regulator protein FrmR [Proteus mirabilis]